MKGWISIEDAAGRIEDGMTVMIGGFLGCGSPHRLIRALVHSKARDLTVIANDGGLARSPAGEEFYGVAKLIHSGKVKKLIASHTGLNPEVYERTRRGEIEMSFLPQGSLAEMIRAGGAGLGGVLTRTGLGTVVEGFEFSRGIVPVDGEDFLLMTPLRADAALIYGDTIDEVGNIWYRGSESNMNLLMATAADLVIAEAGRRVPVGGIEPENIRTSGIFVHYAAEGASYHG